VPTRPASAGPILIETGGLPQQLQCRLIQRQMLLPGQLLQALAEFVIEATQS
jgi:hypothetical protein